MSYIIANLMGMIGLNNSYRDIPASRWFGITLGDLKFLNGFGRGLFTWMMLLWIVIIIKSAILLIHSGTTNNRFHKAGREILAFELILSLALLGFTFLWMIIVFHFDEWWTVLSLGMLPSFIPIFYLDIKRMSLKWKYRPRKAVPKRG